MPLTTLFFDLDDTLYPQSSGLWPAIKQRMNRYMHEQIGIEKEQVPLLREKYHQLYGTTLKGLEKHHVLNKQDFLAYVHDLPLEDFIGPSPQLRSVLEALPHRKFIFTNADAAHARRVLKVLKIDDLFETIIDVEAVSPYCKPMPEAFEIAMKIANETNPANCMMMDDLPRTTRTAKEIGLFSILVGDNTYTSEDADAVLTDWSQLVMLLDKQEQRA